MNQVKIGDFLRELRKEKGLTQEKLAEQFNVARRTVSRWETGSNLPDLDILIEMADYYEVELGEILDGERKKEKMNKDLEETVLKVAELSNEEKMKITRRMHWLFIGGIVAAIVYMVLVFYGNTDNFLGGLCQGIMFGLMIVGFIITSKNATQIRQFKKKLMGKQ